MLLPKLSGVARGVARGVRRALVPEFVGSLLGDWILRTTARQARVTALSSFGVPYGEPLGYCAEISAEVARLLALRGLEAIVVIGMVRDAEGVQHVHYWVVLPSKTGTMGFIVDASADQFVGFSEDVLVGPETLETHVAKGIAP